jgi:pyruvate ferredoxin oxidoreductase gamma subunit
MIEILWHGRGGQGAFTAARLLGAAASLSEGKFSIAFPSFGPERRGAPMRAFTKIDTKSIGNRSAIAKADYVVYLDSTLFADGWEDEIKDGGLVLVNSTKHFDDPRVLSIDASGISREILGREIPNTVFLAAISVLSDALSPDDAKEAIRQYMAPKLHDKNCAIVDEVEKLLVGRTGAQYSCASGEGTEAEGAAGEKSATSANAGSEAANDSTDGNASTANVAVEEITTNTGVRSASASTAESFTTNTANLQRIICSLVENPQLDPEVFAKNTCWQAGHLVSKNAGWRTIRPQLDESKCIGCLQCYMQCPDGTIYKTNATTAELAIDYDFCKGCGICASSCKTGAITMVPEQG